MFLSTLITQLQRLLVLNVGRIRRLIKNDKNFLSLYTYVAGPKYPEGGPRCPKYVQFAGQMFIFLVVAGGLRSCVTVCRADTQRGYKALARNWHGCVTRASPSQSLSICPPTISWTYHD